MYGRCFLSSAAALLLAFTGPGPRAQASYTLFGTSCLTVDLTPVSPPRLGQNMLLSASSGWYGANNHSGRSFLLTGTSNTTFAGLPLPFDTTVLRDPFVSFCGLLYTSIQVVTDLPGGRAYLGPTPIQASIPIPNDPALLGASFYQQLLVAAGAGGSGNSIISLGRGGHGVIGP